MKIGESLFGMNIEDVKDINLINKTFYGKKFSFFAGSIPKSENLGRMPMNFNKSFCKWMTHQSALYFIWSVLTGLMFFTGCNVFNNEQKDMCPGGCREFHFTRIDQEPAWSPDGEAIAFYRLSSKLGESGLYIINMDGDSLRQVHQGPAQAPSWSPDGQWLVFHQYAQIYKKYLPTDSLVQLTEIGRNFHPAWSPDGKWITYDRSIEDELGPGGIWKMKPDGSEKEFIFGGAFPAWHPTSEALLAAIGVSSTSIWSKFVKYYPFSNHPPDTLNAVIGGENWNPRYAPDGQYIVFSSQSPDGGYPQVWVMDSNDSNTVQITENGGWIPDWSPDGKWIVYTETYATGRLWLMRPDGSDKHQLTYEQMEVIKGTQ